MRNIWMVLAVLGLAGCASVAPDLRSGPAVPASKIVQPSITQPGADKGEVVIGRYKDAFGAAIVDARIYIDGERVANIDKGEVLRAYLPKGEHRVGVKILGLDSIEQPVREVSIQVEPASRHEFVVFWTGTAFDIQRKK